MKIHREGYWTISLVFFLLLIINALGYYMGLNHFPLGLYAILIISLAFWLFIVSFFRVPSRKKTLGENIIVCPADGKVVVIEKTVDEEYFKKSVVQISVFMSPLNVHQNLSPANGKVVYNQYHKGKYLVAMNPKSSTLNERHSIVIKLKSGVEILVKQIAGAVARRIVNYAQKGSHTTQSEEFGFIKFGSRVDVLLPTNAIIKVNINQVVKGGVTVLAEIPAKKK